MPDPSEIAKLAGLGGGGFVAKELLKPTLQHYGGRILDGVKARENMIRVLGRAEAKLGDSTPSDPGEAAPRVVLRFLEEAPFAEDEVMAEYLGGILASARLGGREDDRGVAMVALIRDLSVHALRMHWSLYNTMRQLYHPSELTVGFNAAELATFVPFAQLLEDLHIQNDPMALGYVVSAWNALKRNDLVDFEGMGGRSVLQKRSPGVPGDGIIFKPTMAGTELYLWALGLSNVMPNHLLALPEKSFDVSPEIRVVPKGACTNTQLKQRPEQGDAGREG